MVKIFCHILLCKGLEYVDDQGTGDGKGVHQYHQGFMLSQGEGCGEDVGGNGSKHVKGTINRQPQKIYTTSACDRNLFCTLRGGKK